MDRVESCLSEAASPLRRRAGVVGAAAAVVAVAVVAARVVALAAAAMAPLAVPARG
jgi:hypothetical protein